MGMNWTDGGAAQCCGSGMFYPGSDHILIPDPGSVSKHFFIPDPEAYMISGMQTSFFLASYAFRSNVLVILKKDPGSGKKIRPGSGSRNCITGTATNFCGGFYEITYEVGCWVVPVVDIYRNF
jgi:hypothetical protein